jgi:hypothetical protein
MVIIGVRLSPELSANPFFDQETGECVGRRLNHGDGEAEKFSAPG